MSTCGGSGAVACRAVGFESERTNREKSIAYPGLYAGLFRSADVSRRISIIVVFAIVLWISTLTFVNILKNHSPNSRKHKLSLVYLPLCKSTNRTRFRHPRMAPNSYTQGHRYSFLCLAFSESEPSEPRSTADSIYSRPAAVAGSRDTVFYHNSPLGRHKRHRRNRIEFYSKRSWPSSIGCIDVRRIRL